MVPVSLASEVSAGAPLTLNTNPPGGITGALKLVTLADHIEGPPPVEGDRAHAAIFFPPAKYSSTPGIPTEGGLFDGVRQGRVGGGSLVWNGVMPGCGWLCRCFIAAALSRALRSALSPATTQVLFKDFATDSRFVKPRGH